MPWWEFRTSYQNKQQMGPFFFVSWLQVPIDTEHYQNDVKAAARQRKLTDSWSSSGRLRSQSFSP